MKTIEKTSEIAVEAVIIHWAESKLVPVEDVEYKSFEDANKVVEMIAAEERQHKMGGYCKLKFTVKWADGNTWTARLDITGDMYGNGNYIQTEIQNDALFYSGVRPHWMDENEYGEILSVYGTSDEVQEKYKQFLMNYSLD